MTTACLAQSQAAVILPDRIRVQKTVTSIFQIVWVPRTPTEHRLHNFLSRGWCHRGHWMHTFFSFFFFLFSSLLLDRQTQTNAPKHTHKRKGKRNGREAKQIEEGKNHLPPNHLPALPRWPCLWFPAGACCRPAIPPLSQSSPKMEQKLVKMPLKKNADFQHEITSLFSSRFFFFFKEKMHLLHYEVYPWLNELQGEVLKQMNYPWVMIFICTLTGHMDRCMHV